MINSTFIRELAPEYVPDAYGNRISYNSKRQIHSFDDRPALINKRGTKIWYKNGMQHRGNGLPAVMYPSGDKEWWVNGKLIRSEFV